MRRTSSWPGLTRPSTFLLLASRKVVDGRVKPGHDGGRRWVVLPGTWYQAAALRLISSRASTMATVSSSTALRWPFCAAMLCTSRSTRSMLGAPANKARAADDGRTSVFAAAAYFSNGTRSSGDGTELHAQIAHPGVDRARCVHISVHGFLDRSRGILLDTAIVTGHQHRPFRERHENRVMHLQLDRQIDRAVAWVIADRFDLGLHLAQDRGVLVAIEARRLEVCRQRDLEDVDLVFRRAERLRVRAAQGQQTGFEIPPDGRIGIAIIE